MSVAGAQDILRSALGPAVRRARRELQWHSRGVDLDVRRADASGFPSVVAEHATPLVRPLSGVDPQLQRNKVVNLRIAASRLDGIVIDPGVRLSFWREVGKPTYRRGTAHVARTGTIAMSGCATPTVLGRWNHE